MKDSGQQNINQRSSRAVAHSGSGAAVGFSSVNPFPVQRTSIVINDKTLEGSDEEIDPVEFWKIFEEKYQDVDYYTTLKQMIDILFIRQKNKESSEWDELMLGVARANFTEALKYKKFDAVNEEQSLKIKKLLLSSSENPIGEEEIIDQQIKQEEIDQDSLKKLTNALVEYAKATNNPDNPDIELTGENNPYQNIFDRAVEEIMHDYGVQMMHAEVLEEIPDTAFSNLVNAKILHSSEQINKANEQDFEDAKKMAALWVMSNDKKTVNVIKGIKNKIHQQSSLATVRSAYTEALYAGGKKDKEIRDALEKLAKIRLSWGPITYGNDIYLQINQKNPDEENQWWLYQTLIHESLHAAEHKNFTAFLNNSVPEGLRSDIKEGFVEFLTRKIWGRVLDTVKTGTPDDQTNPASKSDKLIIAKKQLTSLKKERESAKREYKAQVDMIEAVIKLLDSGEERLEQAYIYGNVSAFLPKLN